MHNQDSPFLQTVSKVLPHIWVIFIRPLAIDSFLKDVSCFTHWIIFTVSFTLSVTPSLTRTFSQTFLRCHVHQQWKLLYSLSHTILSYNPNYSSHIRKFIRSNGCLNTTKVVWALIWRCKMSETACNTSVLMGSRIILSYIPDSCKEYFIWLHMHINR